ncbi:YecA family protein [Litoribrevibacter euphylliae]|uniref:YecA family protein n=1 Tax=Litoribrevibacter euphylliae TaxID=1834034 RepID=A0ABV7HAB5_9GAMM
MSLDHAHQQLEQILTIPELEEDALDYMGCLGALAAFVITPKDIDTKSITDHILDEAVNALNEDQNSQLNQAIETLLEDLKVQLEGEEGVELPWMSEEDDDDAIISWAAGFVEVVFEYEDLWLNSKFEEDATQLLMPIFAISGILEEETQDITANDQLISQWIDEIPELLIDLFLLFRVIEDKKAPPKNVYGARKNSQKKRGARGKKPNK